MFNFLRGKTLTYEQKLDQAYACYKKDMVGMLFPSGKKQASIVLKSLAKIINADLTNLSATQYYSILQMYTGTLIRMIINKSNDEGVISFLLSKHTEFIHSRDIARRVLAYCVLNIKDNKFGLETAVDAHKLDELMVWNGETEVFTHTVDIMEKAYDKIRFGLLESSLWNKELYCEIIPFLYVLTDFIIVSENKDRKAFHEFTIQWAEQKLGTSKSKEWLYSRIGFYSERIRERYLRGDWLNGAIESFVDYPISRCFVAFGDIIVNPYCVENYQNGAYVAKNIFEVEKFFDIMLDNVIVSVTDFCADIKSIIR